LPDADENLRLLRQRFADRAIMPISAERGEGIVELKTVLERMLVEKRREAAQT